MGGEDLNRIQGGTRPVRATGAEGFGTVAGGEETVERPEPGEIVRCDGRGVTCRRWNRRQGPRTRIDDDTTDALFLRGPWPP